MTNLVDHLDRVPAGMAGPRPSGDTSCVAVLVGPAAVAFSVLYLISDLLELVHGGFSTSQLVPTYTAEAAIPLFVLGLHAVQRPQIGRLGLASAAPYACTFVFFTSTVVNVCVLPPERP